MKKFKEILNSKLVIGALIFIMLSLGSVLAGNVIVKEGSLDIENNLNSSGVLFVNRTSGNVGIGTTTPTTRLQVSGAISSALGSNSVVFNHPNNGRMTFFTNGTSPILSWSQNSINLGFNSWEDSATWQYGIASKPGAIFRVLNGSSSTSPAFTFGATTSISGAPDTIVTMLYNGNIGIGQANPSSLLTVKGAYGNIAHFNATTMGGNLYIDTVNFGMLDVSNNWGFILKKMGDVHMYNANGGVYLNSSGNVGIKTMSPTNNLDVNGYVTLNATSVDDVNYFPLCLSKTKRGSIYIGPNSGSCSSSSLKTKENITNLKFDKEMFFSLNTTNFNYKNDKIMSMGLIAEDVYAIVKNTPLESIVALDVEGIPTAIEQERLIYPLMDIVKENDEEIIKLKQENEDLKKALCEIKPSLELCK